MDSFLLIFILTILGIAWIVEKIKGNDTSMRSRNHTLFSDQSDEILPNGYRRSDYYEFGMTDFDIEYWGLDQPHAPDPFTSGFVIWDLLD